MNKYQRLKLRILYCSQDYSPHDHRFLHALANTDHETYWFRLEQSKNTLEKRDIPSTIHLVENATQKTTRNWIDYGRLSQRFRKLVQSIEPDVIHAGPIQRVALLPALIGFHPLISMSWGFDLLQYAQQNIIWNAVTRFVLSRTDVFLADCQSVRKIAMKCGWNGEKTVIFPWGVDLEVFKPNREKFLRRMIGYEKDLLIIHTRSWEERYGVDVALQGFYTAQKENPNMRMIMLSSGSLKPFVEQFIAKHELQHHILLYGYQTNEQLAQYYQAADIYLSASHVDGSSVALMEALACGCPALVSDIPSNKEWVEDGKEGWLFKDDEPQELAAKLLYITNNRKRLSKNQSYARKKAEQNADWSKNKEKLFMAYEMAVEN